SGPPRTRHICSDGRRGRVPAARCECDGGPRRTRSRTGRYRIPGCPLERSFQAQDQWTFSSSTKRCILWSLQCQSDVPVEQIRTFLQLAGTAVEDDGALVEDEHALGKIEGKCRVLLDQDNGLAALRCELLEHNHQHVAND